LIKINLTPIDELENPLWYVPDVVGMTLAAAACWFFMTSVVEEKRIELEEIQSETAQLENSYENLAQDLEKFNNLEAEVGTLQGKIAALKQITVSKMTKYESVVLLEHLQTLKPDGLWYEKINVTTNGKKVEAVGRSFDPILVAEFMSALQQTKLQKVDPVDLRTQLFFDDVKILSIQQTDDVAKGGDEVINLGKYSTYKLEIAYRTREVEPKEAEIN
jgi:hypothetical protein